MKEKTVNEEIEYLGQMLAATRKEDVGRLRAIRDRLSEILASLG